MPLVVVANCASSPSSAAHGSGTVSSPGALKRSTHAPRSIVGLRRQLHRLVVKLQSYEQALERPYAMSFRNLLASAGMSSMPSRRGGNWITMARSGRRGRAENSRSRRAPPDPCLSRRPGGSRLPEVHRRRPVRRSYLGEHAAAWPALREALKKIGRRDLIGNGPMHLVPSRQPPKRHRLVKNAKGTTPFRTKHTKQF